VLRLCWLQDLQVQVLKLALEPPMPELQTMKVWPMLVLSYHLI
jgi:hypothetical protein